jgi:hypothetical protein
LDPKLCRKCYYWRTAGSGVATNSMKFCHHLLETKVRRVEVDGVCLSLLPTSVKKRKRVTEL